jgi:GDP-4-dehydro-6-deoxy-D-mannose reductase
MRPVKMPVLLGSAERLIARTAWAPRIPLEQTLADTLVYWQQMLKTTSAGQ